MANIAVIQPPKNLPAKKDTKSKDLLLALGHDPSQTPAQAVQAGAIDRAVDNVAEMVGSGAGGRAMAHGEKAAGAVVLGAVVANVVDIAGVGQGNRIVRGALAFVKGAGNGAIAVAVFRAVGPASAAS
jgi:hypothetical protein